MVVVPEAGDEIQTMKAGLMEIADVFVVNKADRPDADMFVKNLRTMLAPTFTSNVNEVKIIKTIAAQKKGIEDLLEAIMDYLAKQQGNKRKGWLLAEKAYYLIQQKRMKDINKEVMKKEIELAGNDFNLYRFIKKYL